MLKLYFNGFRVSENECTVHLKLGHVKILIEGTCRKGCLDPGQDAMFEYTFSR